MKANKCLHVLRTLRKEQYSQAEIGLSFTSLFLPNFIYVIPVYGASESDFKIIQNFLDRCIVISAILLLARVAGVTRRKGIGIWARETAKDTRGGGKGKVPYFPLMARPSLSHARIPLLFSFLNACQEGYFISYPVPIKDLLEKQDSKIFKKVISIDNHPLAPYIPSKRGLFLRFPKQKNVPILKLMLSVSCLPL